MEIAINNTLSHLESVCNWKKHKWHSYGVCDSQYVFGAPIKSIVFLCFSNKSSSSTFCCMWDLYLIAFRSEMIEINLGQENAIHENFKILLFRGTECSLSAKRSSVLRSIKISYSVLEPSLLKIIGRNHKSLLTWGSFQQHPLQYFM